LVKVKVGKCSSSKDLWDKLQKIYYKESPLITDPEHVDQDKEDSKTKQEEGSSSDQTDPKEDYAEEGEIDLEE
jgi:hypothetical protein